MSKYEYVQTSYKDSMARDFHENWEKEMDKITGEIVDTVKRDGYTVGVIVMERQING